jgi:hypothetical protein
MQSSPIQVHVSPEGEWQGRDFSAHGWTSGDNRAKTWTYWWIQIDAKGLNAAEYEVLRDGVVVVQRTRLVSSPKLFAKTGFVDEEPDPPGSGPVGGAAKLDAGIYGLDFYLTLGNSKHVLRGVRFEVAERKAAKGGWQIKTPLPDDTTEG